ncbi:MAG: glycosyltransferase family 39 protein [Candidatus Woesearchaeota archaeon]
MVSRILLEPFHGKEYVWVYSKYLWLDIWGVHDTGWYLNVAANGYPPGFDPAVQSNWAFFPLYPLLMRLLGGIVGSNYVAGIIISNVCLIVAAIFLYKLVKLDADKQTAFGAVKYMFLFPTAFVLSGVFTESLFLLLAITGFYYAKKGKWWAAGIAGFFLSLTKSLGIILVVPLLYEYLKTKNFKIEKIRKDILWLGLIPLGLIVFSIYNFYKTGNYLAFAYVQKAWGHGFSNPLKFIVNGSISSNLGVLFASYFTLALLVIIIFYKKVDTPYLIFSLFLFIIPLLSIPTYESFPRYLIAIFPLFIIFAKLGKNQYLNSLLTICFGLLQGFLMVFWANGFKLVI